MLAAYPPVQIQKKRGMGCLGCGCAILVILVLLVIGLIAATGWYGYNTVRGYTGESPVAVPQFDGGDPVFASAQQQIKTFQQALQGNRPASLHLTADQINTLILHDDSFSALQGHVFVVFKGDEATLQFSLPLKSFETYLFPDRYLNGDATFALSFDSTDKSLNLDLHGAHLAGHDLPAGFNDGFNRSFNQVFNQKLQSNPTVHDFLNRTTKFTVENGELIIETQ
jgi:hypothetical protein